MIETKLNYVERTKLEWERKEDKVGVRRDKKKKNNKKKRQKKTKQKKKKNKKKHRPFSVLRKKSVFLFKNLKTYYLDCSDLIKS